MKRIGIYLLAVLLLAGAIGCSKASASQPVQAEASPLPTQAPAQVPTAEPTQAPAQVPTAEPTHAPTAEPKTVLPDGVYTATFKTDSTMFKVNEAFKNKGILTVKDGQMTIHITLVSKSILNLFPGLAEDAQREGAKWLEPTVDPVDYHDGTDPEEVYGFDVPVPVIGEEFDLALVGTKGKWYDHKVIVTDPEPQA